MELTAKQEKAVLDFVAYCNTQKLLDFIDLKITPSGLCTEEIREELAFLKLLIAGIEFKEFSPIG